MLRENKDAFGFPVEFYARPAQQVAPDLIGCQLSIKDIAVRVVADEDGNRRADNRHGPSLVTAEIRR